ncbi:hypothetical protein BGZ72_009581 [Mortierella alpina]|nr:hypothetical protein BGZ72_009581 [Mortierella alpina]
MASALSNTNQSPGQHDDKQTTTTTHSKQHLQAPKLERIATKAATPEIQTKELKEAFNLYDRKGTGSIPSSDLGSLLRAIKQNPSEAEIKELIAQSEPTLSFDAFSKIALRPDGFKPAATAEQMVEGFKVFDPQDNGTISEDELRRVLTTMGEALSTQEVDELLREAKIEKNGMISYEDFVRNLLA